MPFKNKQARLEYQRIWIADRRKAFFAGKCCAKCGSTYRLELDHTDPAQKVSHRIWSWSAKRRNEELAKCQVLCCDCHLEKTVSESQTARCGDASMYRRGCRCDRCKFSQRLRMREYRASKRLTQK